MIVYKELSSLEADLGISAKTLYGISNNINGHYREKKIRKSDGGYRTLSIPDEVLKKVQRAIVERLLVYVPVSVYAKAYKVGSSTRKNAACHVGKENLLKLDIYRFFDNISYSTVKEKVFPSEKYSEQIRILLSMLCYRNESLPQGAPTSPIISNIVMYGFDRTVGEWCGERGIVYTRYCDDMTFSGSFDEKEVLSFVSAALRSEGFILNDKKTVFLKRGKRKTVTGIVVNERLNIPKEYRRELRKELYYCKKHGVAEHLSHVGDTRSPSSYLSGLLGRINYVLQIDPKNEEFLLYKKQLCEMIKENK